MAEMSPGTALRQIQAAQAGLKKVRKAMLVTRAEPDREDLRHEVIRQGWDALIRAHRELAAIPLSAANEAVLTKQLALQKYATSLLVRLRRLIRNDPKALEGLEAEDADDAE